MLGGVYFITAKAGLSLSPVSGFATLVWPPTGIALATLFIFGKRLWPGVFLGAALVNLVTGASPLVAVGIGVGNTLEAVAGAYILHKLDFRRQLDRIKDIVLLVIIAACLSTLISATIGTTSLLIGNTIILSSYGHTWLAWWIGDMLGAIIAAPIIFVWIKKYHLGLKRKQWIEAIIISVTFLSVAFIIFEDIITKSSGLQSAPYLLFPFLIWATLRFSVRLIVLFNATLAAVTVYAAIHSYGPFVGDTVSDRLFSSQLFIGVTAVTFLFLSAAMAERRHAQATTMELNQKLKQALVRKTRELHREKEIEKLKDEFVAIASHELKTPITTVKAFANLLDKRLKGSKDKNSALLASKIDTQVDKLTRLADELMDVSRIESGKLVLKKSKFDIYSLLAKTITDLQHTVPSHQFVNQIKSLPKVSGDKARIEQVILNLLANAVKYSPEGTKIIITAHTNRRELTISVQDFGPGIPKHELTKIFKRFYRTADNSKDKQSVSGIGLGLYIADVIIKQHNGKIWAKSTLGKGSTFSFSLALN